MRGIEAVVALVLLLIMTVGLVAVVWMIFGPTMRQTSQTTGGQVKSTAAQHAEETILQNLRSTCENNVGGHFIPKGFTGVISLDVAGAKVTLNAGDAQFPDAVLCVYRSGTEADSPVVIAQVDFTNSILANLSKGETVNLQWHVARMCPVINGQAKLNLSVCTATKGTTWTINCEGSVAINTTASSYNDTTHEFTITLVNGTSLVVPAVEYNSTYAKTYVIVCA